MKNALKLLTAVAVIAAGGLALAGDCSCGSGCPNAANGFSCQNMCPLAQKANEHRSFGSEGSAARLTALASQVQKSLAKV